LPNTKITPPVRADFTFASDNCAGICPEAWAALAAANSGRVESYGADAWTAGLNRSFGAVFGTECEVHLVFNGTAANALAVAQLCRSHQSIICHADAHVDTDECGAPEFFTGGSKVIPLAGRNAKLWPADILPVLRRDRGVHFQKPGAISITQSTEWSTVYTPDEVRALAALAHAHGMALHMDGARFANAAATLAERGITPADCTWRAGVDVLCFGGTKNGLSSSVAVVFFNRALARDFAYRVKQTGQLDSKMRFAAAQWIALLRDGAWLRNGAAANARARQLASAVRSLPSLRLIMEPEANGVFVELPPDVYAALAARGWHFYRFSGEHGYRLMCAWDTTEQDVAAFTADLRAVAGGRARKPGKKKPPAK
jgi:threonine aldolase